MNAKQIKEAAEKVFAHYGVQPFSNNDPEKLRKAKFMAVSVVIALTGAEAMTLCGEMFNVSETDLSAAANSMQQHCEEILQLISKLFDKEAA